MVAILSVNRGAGRAVIGCIVGVGRWPYNTPPANSPAQLQWHTVRGRHDSIE